MTIQPLGFIDTSNFTAMFLVGKTQKERTQDGILRLRDIKDGEAEVTDLPILKEWKGAKVLLTRLRNAAAGFFDGRTPELGRAWVEILPPQSGTPWLADLSEYADQHVRTRTCLIPSPGALSFCGGASASLGVGVVNLMDHHLLCSEVNHGEHARVHLIVDVRIPGDDDAAET